jgi:hypothetical protein
MQVRFSAALKNHYYSVVMDCFRTKAMNGYWLALAVRSVVPFPLNLSYVVFQNAMIHHLSDCGFKPEA